MHGDAIFGTRLSVRLIKGVHLIRHSLFKIFPYKQPTLPKMRSTASWPPYEGYCAKQADNCQCSDVKGTRGQKGQTGGKGGNAGTPGRSLLRLAAILRWADTRGHVAGTKTCFVHNKTTCIRDMLRVFYRERNPKAAKMKRIPMSTQHARARGWE